MTRMPSDAGLTVLELVVALGITSGVVAMIVASLPRSRPTQEVVAVQIADFVAKVRKEAILSGRAQVLHVSAGSMSSDRDRLVWGADASAPIPTRNDRLVLYPDGSVSGGALSIDVEGEALRITVPSRDGVEAP
jgi:hypothetical protein